MITTLQAYHKRINVAQENLFIRKRHHILKKYLKHISSSPNSDIPQIYVDMGTEHLRTDAIGPYPFVQPAS